MSAVVDWRARARDAHQEGNLAKAQQAYQNWLVESPDDADAIHGLGVCAIAEGKNQDAVALFERALTLSPQHAAVRRNLGVAYWTVNRRTESLAMLEESDRLEPNNAHTHFNLAVALMGLGESDRAIASYRTCLAIDPMHALAHSNLIFMLDLLADDDAAMEERHRFEERHGPPARAQWQPHTNTKDLTRRLKIGYVSGDYQFHSASFAFRPVLLNHDRDRFEVYCYSSTVNHDQTTEWFRDEYRWRGMGQLPPDILVQGIRRDQIDILIDLSGHSKDNRLLMFALKPAPVQVTAWGHALGTGLTAIDYMFSDPRVLPHDRRERFAETVVDLPALVCYEPQQPAPPVKPLTDRPLTFGGFQRMEKISAITYDMWSAVLKAVPGSRLIVKCPDFEESRHRTRVHEAFSRRGIDPARVELRGKTTHYVQLDQINDVDVMLDTFPHGGGMGAIEALWMGVPLITRQGQNIQSRLASSFLALVDLEENIATGLDGYVALAKTQITARSHLAMLRGTLRDRLLKSPLCDHVGYTRAVEDHYREFWRRWCQT
jgi:protein O-GlcNAc transferase